MTFILGVDVSSYQTDTYNISGCSFAIVKCSESTTYVNPKYAAQLAHARTNGLLAGHYHYARGTDSDAQVAYFAKHSDVRAGEIIAMDWEQSEVTAAARDEFLHKMKATFPHNRVILYCNVDYWTTRDTEHYAADGLWVADYSASPGKPRISQPWVFHQYSSAGGEDHSVGNFTSRAALAAWSLALTNTDSEEDMLYFPIQVTEDKDGKPNRAGQASWPAGVPHVLQLAADPSLYGAKSWEFRVALHHADRGPVVVTVTVAAPSNTAVLELSSTAAHLPTLRGVTITRPDGATGPWAGHAC